MNVSKPLVGYRQTLLHLLILTTLMLGLFSYTVSVRQPWMGQLGTMHHQWLTASAVKFAHNWYIEGPWTYWWTMEENPPSIEFPTLASREPYASYPPGTVISIYFLSLLRHHAPTVSLVMQYNLLNQLLITLSLSFTMYAFGRYRRLSPHHALVWAIIPILTELFLPAPLYWHQNTFFSDQAVLLPFSASVLLEVLRWQIPAKHLRIWLDIATGLVLFWGVFTDWLMIFVVLVIFAIRLLDKQISPTPVKRCLMEVSKIALGPAIAGVLYLAQLVYLGVGRDVLAKFIFRSALSHDGQSVISNFHAQFWSGYVAYGFGQTGLYLLEGSIALFAILSLTYLLYALTGKPIEKQSIRTLLLIALYLLPCLAQIYAFKNHDIIHEFSILKLSLPLATVPLVLIPWLLGDLTGLALDQWSLSGITLTLHKPFLIRLPIAVSALLIFTILYVHSEFATFRKFFTPANPDFATIGQSLAVHTTFDSVVFSPDFEILANPPHALAYSGKRVYLVHSRDEVRTKMRQLPPQAQPILVFKQQPTPDQLNLFHHPPSIRSDNLYYYRLPHPQ